MGQNNRQPRGPGTLRRRVLTVGLSVLFASVALTLIVATAWSMWVQRQQTLQQGGRDGLNLAWTLSERVARALETADDVLVESQVRLFSQGALHPLDTRALTALLTLHRLVSPELRSLELFDANGRLMVSAQEGGGMNAPVHSRDFFVGLRERPTLPNFVGLPVRNGDDWLIPIARRVNGIDGGFDGLLVVTIDTGSLRQAVQRLELDPRTVFCVARLDGRILFRHPYLESAVGADTTSTQVHQAKKEANGTMQAVSALDGIERLYAYTRLTSFPLTMTVGIPTDSLLAGWRGDSLRKAVFTGVALIFAAFLFALLLRQLTRIERSEARFQAIFRNSPVPTAIFTVEEGRLLDGNGAFFDLIEASRGEMIGKTSVEHRLLERRGAPRGIHP